MNEKNKTGQPEAEKILFYNLTPQTYRTDTKVEVDPYCNGFTAVNIGTTPLIINGVPLLPPAVAGGIGESVSFGGNRGEVYIGRIDLQFPNGTGGVALITQKVYEPLYNKFLKL